MLQRLYVKNIALISEADIFFDGKLNILSGETGSGKSVILDSINFVLGSKADKTMIRFGEREMSVRAEFAVDPLSEAVKTLKEYDIESDGEIIITRRYDIDGKGGIKINGNAVTATMLKAVTQRLVDVHGQSEHFFLLGEDNQLKVLDGLLGSDARKLKEEISSLIAEKRKIKSKIKELGGNGEERERQLDILNYQINEITSAALQEGEYDSLKERQNVLLNGEKIISALNAVHSVISDDGGCLDGINSAKHYAAQISGLSESYSNLYDRIEGLAAEAEDLAETVSDLADEVSFDEKEAERIDERLTLIKGLMKKYGSTEKEILEFCEAAERKAEALGDSAALIEKYTAEIEAADGKIYENCQKLTKARKAAGEKFCAAVTEQLKTLNIPNALFDIEFSPYDRETADLNNADGADKVRFMFSANRGEPLKPLNKVISGGEMSRFMLAVKTQLKDVNGISTYIFDEIDAGISGYTAKTVAEKFLDISKNTQIIAVSHLPQVCAASDAQFLIYKEEIGGKTLTRVKKLDKESKVEEIIRLTGGGASDAARRHAIELIESYKK